MTSGFEIAVAEGRGPWQALEAMMQAGFDEQNWWNELLGGNADPALVVPDDVWDTAVAAALDGDFVLRDDDLVAVDQPGDEYDDVVDDVATVDDEINHAAHHNGDPSAHDFLHDGDPRPESDGHATRDPLDGDAGFVGSDDDDNEF